MTGYVLVHRSLFGNPQFRGKDDEYAALWFISHAAWQETTIRIARKPITLKRGQCAYALSYLATAWETSKSSTRRIVEHLKKVGFLETHPGTDFHLITVCKYNEYQLSGTEGETHPGTEGETQVKRKRNAPGTNKKESNTGNAKPPQPPRGGSADVFNAGHSPGDTPPAKPEKSNGKKVATVSSEINLAVDAWNEFADGHDLSRIVRLTDARRKKLQARLKDVDGLQGWKSALGKAAESPGLLGSNGRGWKVDFDFMVSESGLVKVIEGKYADWTDGGPADALDTIPDHDHMVDDEDYHG